MRIKKLPPPGIELFKVKEVAEILECTNVMVYRLINTNKLDFIKKGERKTRIPKTSVDKYIALINE